MILTYRYRVKNLSGELNRQARAVNFVWNYCNDRQRESVKWQRKRLTAFDLNNLTAGSSKELGVLSDTINQVCQQYVKSRSQQKRRFLRYRGRRSLGWVPVKGRALLRRPGNAFAFGGKTYRVFNSRPLPEGKITDGTSFSQDARGRWYLNIAVEVAEAPRREVQTAVGIDLGLKDLAVLSTGEAIQNPHHYRGLEERLGKAQRARRKRQAAGLAARVANRRRDALHKLSTRLVLEFDYIAVGDVSPAGLKKTGVGKAVSDASWSSLRFMLAYKAIRHGATYQEVNERFTTQACSSCGVIPDSSPKGRTALGIRHWVCSECGAGHDRDVNAALNILAGSGHRSLVEGALAVHG